MLPFLPSRLGDSCRRRRCYRAVIKDRLARRKVYTMGWDAMRCDTSLLHRLLSAKNKHTLIVAVALDEIMISRYQTHLSSKSCVDSPSRERHVFISRNMEVREELKFQSYRFAPILSYTSHLAGYTKFDWLDYYRVVNLTECASSSCCAAPYFLATMPLATSYLS